MRGVFVTGTGTGVGKSIVAAALCAALVHEGHAVMASKPLLSGMDDAPEPPWPHDHDLLALVTGESADAIAPMRFGPAVSPHLAARLEGMTLDVDALVVDIRARYDQRATSPASSGAVASVVSGAASSAATAATSLREAAREQPVEAHNEPIVVVEGAGGLLVPIDDDATSMATLALELDLPLLIAAHPGLGTINHVLLTVEASRARGLTVAGVVLTPWPDEPTLIEADNRAFLEAHAGVPIHVLSRVDAPDPKHLAAAGLAAALHVLI